MTSIRPVDRHPTSTIVASPTVRPSAAQPAAGDNDGDVDRAKGNDAAHDTVTISRDAQAMFLANQADVRHVV